MDTKDQYIEKLLEYIQYLGKNISDSAGYLYVHGQFPEQKILDQGSKLREELEILKLKLYHE